MKVVKQSVVSSQWSVAKEARERMGKLNDAGGMAAQPDRQDACPTTGEGAMRRSRVSNPWAVAMRAFGFSGLVRETTAAAGPTVWEEDEGELDYDEIRALVKRCVQRGWVMQAKDEGRRQKDEARNRRKGVKQETFNAQHSSGEVRAGLAKPTAINVEKRRAKDSGGMAKGPSFARGASTVAKAMVDGMEGRELGNCREVKSKTSSKIKNEGKKASKSGGGSMDGRGAI